MKVNFDLEKLNKLLEDFYKVTSLTVSLWDADHNQLAYCPKEIPRFCKMIKSTEEGAAACLKSDIALCKLSYQKREPVLHYCHAGLLDVATPILHNDTLLGYMMFGQVLDKGDLKPNLTVCKKYGLNEKDLLSAFAEIKFFNKDIIDAAMRILKICTHYLWISQMITKQKNLLAYDIETFIQNNLNSDITVNNVCEHFQISKNKLYKITDTFFGDSFNRVLNNKRIEKAKNLLESTDDPIYIICAQVGIPDYNYFTKVFKKEVGTTPRDYRKNKVWKK